MICTDNNKIEEALKIQEDMKFNHSCLMPCKFLLDFTNDGVENPYVDNTHYLLFNSELEKRQAKYIYGIIDLLAALGGYLGSFLGVSLFHLREGFAFLIRKINQCIQFLLEIQSML